MSFHYLKRTIFVLLGTVSFAGLAADIGTVTLKSGAIVLLHDDYTWEYVVINTDSPSNTTFSEMNNAAEIIPLGVDQIAKNKSTLLRSGVLKTGAKNGVKVSYSDSIWRDKSLGLTFILSSNNNDGVVIVKVQISFYDDSLNKIVQQTVNVWQASYRLPETYLRKGETRNSRVIWIDGINKTTWRDQLLSVEVVEVETR